MKYRLFTVILLLSALLALSACGSDDTGSSSDTASADTSAASEDAASAAPSADPASADSSASAKEPSSASESGPAEGENAVPGEIQEVTPDASVLSVGDTIDVEGQNGISYRITIDEIAATEERSPYEDSSYRTVVKVVYTVKNTSESDPVLIDTMSFRMTDPAQKALSSYFFDTEADARAEILPVEAGKSASFAVGFAAKEDLSSVTLIFDDLFGGTGETYTIGAEF